MRKATDLSTTVHHLDDAFAAGRPVTISYLKEEKDDNGRRTGRLVETVRTIEIYDAFTTKAGNVIFRAMDRQTGEARSWRPDRVTAYTVHRTAYTVELPPEIADKLAEAAADAPTTVEEFVSRELERDADAPAVTDPADLTPAAA